MDKLAGHLIRQRYDPHLAILLASLTKKTTCIFAKGRTNDNDGYHAVPRLCPRPPQQSLFDMMKRRKSGKRKVRKEGGSGGIRAASALVRTRNLPSLAIISRSFLVEKITPHHPHTPPSHHTSFRWRCRASPTTASPPRRTRRPQWRRRRRRPPSFRKEARGPRRNFSNNNSNQLDLPRCCPAPFWRRSPFSSVWCGTKEK